MPLARYTDNISKKLIKQHKIEKPILVLFEGVDTEIYKNTAETDNDVTKFLDEVEPDFNFLFVGHWLKGKLSEDRKNIGGLIASFVKAFKDKEKQPGLILKASSATFSVIQREIIIAKIREAIGGVENPPPIYLLFGELTDEEMNTLYNHNKVKAMVNITRGEGFGRPLLEFTMTGKPIIASNWSGHKDFLPISKSLLVGGKLTSVDDSAVDSFIIKESKWFTANYEEFIMLIRNLQDNYENTCENSQFLRGRGLMQCPGNFPGT